MPPTQEVLVPDIGDFTEVDVVEVAIHVGDTVVLEQPLVTLESDKAALEVPSPVAGTVRQVHLAVGAKASQGSRIATIEVAEGVDKPAESNKSDTSDKTNQPDKADTSAASEKSEKSDKSEASDTSDQSDRSEDSAKAGQSDQSDRSEESEVPAKSETSAPPYAGPSVRRLARQLGVDLARVDGSGPKGRIRPDDVHGFVRQTLSQATANASPPAVSFDPHRFGPVDIVPLTRIQKIAGRNLQRSWNTIPHVTHFDEADITDLEAFRLQHAEEAAKSGIKLTFLAFIARAAASTLLRFPRCNASLLADGESLVLRRYVNLGFAVDTDDGLLVPVLRDADKKTILQLAGELGEISARAHSGKATPGDLQGATFTISSLGGIGGSGFTPIINSPEVAILGVSRTQTKPIYRDGQFAPRLLLPVCLSYDHRVIDGAAAARFTRHLCTLLEDLRRILL